MITSTTLFRAEGLVNPKSNYSEMIKDLIEDGFSRKEAGELADHITRKRTQKTIIKLRKHKE